MFNYRGHDFEDGLALFVMRPICISESAKVAIKAVSANLIECLQLHQIGHYGSISPKTREANENSCKRGGDVFSIFTFYEGETIWIATALDSGLTAVFLALDWN